MSVTDTDTLAAKIAFRVGDYLDTLVKATQRAFVDGLAPKKAHSSDAAFDIYAAEQLTLYPHGFGRIKAGFTIAIPEGYVGLVCSRSGHAANHGVFVLNAPGVIDPGYRGEVGVVLMNLGENIARFQAGDRIAQLLIVPAPSFTLVQNKNAFTTETDRGEHGFGSTGVA